jgi:hypothetical protein
MASCFTLPFHDVRRIDAAGSIGLVANRARCGAPIGDGPLVVMAPNRNFRFRDQKEGFREILSDRHWPVKVLLAVFC